MTSTERMPRLSICIATLNRANFIGETLDTIVPQLCDGVEVLIVDGASTDATAEVVSGYVAQHSRVRSVRLDRASGVDQDYDHAVALAKGEFVWLMTDDDLLKPGAIDRVLAALDSDVDLVVLNSEVRSADFRSQIAPALIDGDHDRALSPDEANSLLVIAANALSFIGCVIIRREFWRCRNREAYYGSLFVHVGVIFQGAAPRTKILAEPLILVRYGNAMWTPRGFEIWMFKWPSLVWSFENLSPAAKRQVCVREPWRQLRKLWLYRSIGGYGASEYRRFIRDQAMPLPSRVASWAISKVPTRLANSIASLWCGVLAPHARMNIYDLARSVHATALSRFVARRSGF